MATIRQKTSFGPGIYRGHKFDLDRLRSFVEGTNKAIASGVPIPLLKKHAPINASDSDTEQFATSEGQGAGWIKKVSLSPEGSIEWEAENVPEDIVKAVQEGTTRFTSPEFRNHYESEKAGVYQGPIIRHFAFTPLPGNPIQGAIETVALEEKGVFQFSELDKEAVHEMPTDNNEYYKAEVGSRIKVKSGTHAGKTGTITAVSDSGYKCKLDNMGDQDHDLDFKEVGPVNDMDLKADSQHAEKNSDGFKKPENEEPPASPMMEMKDGQKEEPPAEPINPDVNPQENLSVQKNPDMPPKATDKTKLAAVLAGLNQKNIVLPSTFDFNDDNAIDVLLAAINSAIKAEQETEAEAQPEEEEETPKDAPMPFSEQFSEEELATLPPKVRVAVEAGRKALEAERAAREAAEREALAFAEKERETRNKAARDKARDAISRAKIPPALRLKLLESFGDSNQNTVQFAEGVEIPYYTASQVASMVEEAIPPFLQFTEDELKEGKKPSATLLIGKDAQGNPIYRTEKDSEQFFEEGGTPGHVSPERAREIVSKSPGVVGLMPTPSYQFTPSISQLVNSENQRVPNNVMRK